MSGMCGCRMVRGGVWIWCESNGEVIVWASPYLRGLWELMVTSRTDLLYVQ
jgi:hypothetical protein